MKRKNINWKINAILIVSLLCLSGVLFSNHFKEYQVKDWNHQPSEEDFDFIVDNDEYQMKKPNETIRFFIITWNRTLNKSERDEMFENLTALMRDTKPEADFHTAGHHDVK